MVIKMQLNNYKCVLKNKKTTNKYEQIKLYFIVKD